LQHFCFSLIWVAAGMGTALVAAGAADRPQRITSVVRPDVRTGKLVRSVIVTPKPVAGKKVEEPVATPREVSAVDSSPASPAPPPSPSIDEAVEQIAARHSLSPRLIHSVIKVESNYNPNAVSPKGALGLMQLIPSTARRFGVSDVFDPMDNITGGAKYLKYLLDLYAGNYPLALAAYNAGEAAVARYGGVPPYPETQNYVVMVRKELEKFQASDHARSVSAKAVPALDVPAGPSHVQQIVEPDGSVHYVSR
jgi:hypothetical protein